MTVFTVYVRAYDDFRLFILQGAVTFMVAVGAVFTLPDEPLTTKWLTADERQLTFDRIARETVGKREKSSTFAGLKEAASDYRVWVFAFMQHMVSRQRKLRWEVVTDSAQHLASNGFKNFFPTVVE
jgi:hypothetical protein